MAHDLKTIKVGNTSKELSLFNSTMEISLNKENHKWNTALT